MSNKEKTQYGWKVSTIEPIYILLLKNENEYYDFCNLIVGTADCGCEMVETFGSEVEVMEHIVKNKIQRIYDTDSIQP